MEKQVSVTEYAKSQGCTRQLVLLRLGNNELHRLPGVTKAEKIGTQWVLTVKE